MEGNASKIIIETIVRKTIRDIKQIEDSPERSTRNVVDMALEFSNGRFQKRFFSTLQKMLQNEHSAYYGLVRDVVTHVDTERLVTFGMNLGYNSCIIGARVIRKNETVLGCDIPWTVSLSLDGSVFSRRQEQYRTVVEEGKKLGIYTWMLFAQSQPLEVLSLAACHPDCAFILFCSPEDVTIEFLDAASGFNDLMIVVRYNEDADEACAQLRRAGLLYSVYYPYSEEDIPYMISGDLFCGISQLHPVFGVLLAQPGCPAEVRHLVADVVAAARKGQEIQILLWELDHDNHMVDQIISENDCTAYFDCAGTLCKSDGTPVPIRNGLFDGGLPMVFQQAFPKRS